MGDCRDRILRRGQADAQQSITAKSRKPLQRKGQMRAAFVRRDRMNFIDDDRARRRQHLAAGFRAEQDIERLRRGDEDVRWTAAHALAFGGRRVPGAHPAADLDIGQAASAELLANAGQGYFQIAVNVVRQRFQRRDIDHLRLIGQLAFEGLPNQRVDGGEKCGKRFAGARWRGDQRVPAGLDRRPGFRLRPGGRSEAVGEPGRDGRMKKPGLFHGDGNATSHTSDLTDAAMSTFGTRSGQHTQISGKDGRDVFDINP